jgi:hypothetical protein
LTPAWDGLTVEMAARTVDEIARYRQHIAEHGYILTEPLFTAAGKITGERQVPNPAVRMLRDAEYQLERWLMILAIPPGARAGHGLAQVQAADKLVSLLERRRRPTPTTKG